MQLQQRHVVFPLASTISVEPSLCRTIPPQSAQIFLEAIEFVRQIQHRLLSERDESLSYLKRDTECF